MRRLRIGLVGAARIAPHGIIDPVRAEPRSALVAVAARDADRAAAFAAEHGIERSYGDYAALFADPDIDLVYIATPPANHAELAIKALEAGKHVLVEKPFSLTSAEASAVLAVARRNDRRVVEAMHAIHHPLFYRVAGLVSAGTIGAIREVASRFDITLANPDDFRWHGRLGGGALMDLGVYPLALVRRLLGEDFTVDQAKAVLRGDTDEAFEARLLYAGGIVARVSASLVAPFAADLRIEGDRGTIAVFNPIAPHRGHRLIVEADGSERHEEEVPGPTTWTAQLSALCDTLLDGKPFPLPEDDFVHSMIAIERVRAAGGWPSVRDQTE
jgi:predicted dehydrogenase